MAKRARKDVSLTVPTKGRHFTPCRSSAFFRPLPDSKSKILLRHSSARCLEYAEKIQRLDDWLSVIDSERRRLGIDPDRDPSTLLSSVYLHRAIYGVEGTWDGVSERLKNTLSEAYYLLYLASKGKQLPPASPDATRLMMFAMETLEDIIHASSSQKLRCSMEKFCKKFMSESNRNSSVTSDSESESSAKEMSEANKNSSATSNPECQSAAEKTSESNRNSSATSNSESESSAKETSESNRNPSAVSKPECESAAEETSESNRNSSATSNSERESSAKDKYPDEWNNMRGMNILGMSRSLLEQMPKAEFPRVITLAGLVPVSEMQSLTPIAQVASYCFLPPPVTDAPTPSSSATAVSEEEPMQV